MRFITLNFTGACYLFPPNRSICCHNHFELKLNFFQCGGSLKLVVPIAEAERNLRALKLAHLLTVLATPVKCSTLHYQL